MDTADILSLILYTGTDVQGDFRGDMLSKTGRWKWLTYAISRAIRRGMGALDPRSRPEIPVVYHGLHNVTIHDLEAWVEFAGNEGGWGCILPMPVVMSTSTDRETSVRFAAGAGGTASPSSTRGLLLECRCRANDVVACDVSWVSKFQNEEEIAVAPFQNFHVDIPPCQTRNEYLAKLGNAVTYIRERVDGIDVTLQHIKIKISTPLVAINRGIKG
jgi:hypothetical protein